MHAKGWGHGTFTVTRDISRYTRAKIFDSVGKQTPLIARFSMVQAKWAQPMPSVTCAASQ